MVQSEEKSLAELQRLKEEIENHKGENFSIYTFAQKQLKWSPIDVFTLINMNVVAKKPFDGSKTKNIYSWVGVSPSLNLLKKLVVKRKELQNSKNKINSKKKKLKKEELEKERLKQEQIDTVKNTFKDLQKVEVPVLEKEEIKVTPEQPEPVKEVISKKSDIPISIEVISEGDLKTVTIKITV